MKRGRDDAGWEESTWSRVGRRLLHSVRRRVANAIAEIDPLPLDMSYGESLFDGELGASCSVALHLAEQLGKPAEDAVRELKKDARGGWLSGSAEPFETPPCLQVAGPRKALYDHVTKTVCDRVRTRPDGADVHETVRGLLEAIALEAGGVGAYDAWAKEYVEKERERLGDPVLMNSEWRLIVHACTRREDMPASSTVLATRLSEAFRLYCSPRNLDAVVDTALQALENCADEESVTFREAREKLLPLYFAAVPLYDHLDTLADAFKQ